MGPTGGDGDGIRQVGGNGRLASPNGYTTVGLESDAVRIARTNGDDVAQRDRRRGLAKKIIAPTGDGAIALQRQAVLIPGGYSSCIGQRCRRLRLKRTVVTPCDNGRRGARARIKNKRY